ncbi:hypothetical protein HOD83_02400 [Candidatus Woesearchaeota archaeon]|jgi:beta-1,4-N-acetylglucosaminyltransferase|nr:hypothetical protein [Candidatus Woesearchaeota archaeon]MBT4114140.1 hypothetical protein [Candidatus Woesearchaeota archaeon]MBT4248417.1 hypothetical protein [Candidatus Woesearchaeota archaeon]
MGIFVTVGTGKFDALIKEVDRLAPKLKTPITMQIGSGDYKPLNCKWFRFAPNLEKYYKQANLIIAHGGTGTTFELLAMHKKLISCANKERNDLHQVEFLEALSKESGSFIYCKDIGNLSKSIQKVKKVRLKKYDKPACYMDREIHKLLNAKCRRSKMYLIRNVLVSYFTLAKIVLKSGSKNES